LAAVTKFGASAAVSHLRHILREVKKPRNIDIDPARTPLNYFLSPQRHMKPYTYLQKRLREVRCQNREDVNVMCGWVITKPKDLPELTEEKFFRACYDFLEQRYGGKKNVVSAVVHKDESGEAHLHFYFVPVAKCTPNETMVRVIQYMKQHPTASNVTYIARDLGISRKTVRRYWNMTEADIKDEKLSAMDVVNLYDLQTFHSDLKKYLERAGIKANVSTGITREQGGNRTVAELKRERDAILHEQEHDQKYSY